MSEIVPMHYELVKDLPGYLRIRYGALAFTAEEGYGVAEELRRVPGVQDVTTNVANGGVLVRYDEQDKDCRSRLIDMFATFEREDLPRAQRSEEQFKREIDAKFVNDLVLTAVFHFARRLLLPSPLRIVFNAFKALSYVRRGGASLVRGRITVEVLDATAIASALLQGMYDSAGSVMFLLQVSDLLEEYTHARSKLALERSLALNVDDVWLVTPDGDITVDLDDVRAGDLLRVRTGVMVPVDGEIVEGEAAVNEATMTGESKLIIKDEGASVYAGTIVDDGNIIVRARQVGTNTRIHNIVSLIDESEKLKAGVQSRAERLADAIVPFSFLAFFGVFAATRNIAKALSVLMVDYSCAIKLSTPVAVMSAMREAASRGIVVKGGRFLEVIAEADTIIFDKTGTLTTACPEVERVISFGDMEEGEILRIAACLEEHFPHSMARAVVTKAQDMGILHNEEAHAEVKYVVAHGIASALDGKDVVLGSEHYVFEDEGVKPPPRFRQRVSRMAPGCSVIYLAVDCEAVGAICITDPVREEAASTVAALREAGFNKVVMLTGDAEGAAKAAAEKLGIDEYHAQVLPEDKAAIIEDYQSRGHEVVMVGDGINDSPALAAASCSVAMVDASDIAREVADVTLLNSSLDELLVLRKLGCGLMQRIGRNYRIIVGFNTALLAAGVAGVMQPTSSALLHNGSTMLVTAGNMRPVL